MNRYAVFLETSGLEALSMAPSDIDRYIANSIQRNGEGSVGSLSPATIGRKLSILSSYYDWLQHELGETIRNPVRSLKRPKVQNALSRPVEDHQLAQLVHGIDNARDRAIVLLLVYSGLRLSELASLNKEVIRIRGKRNPDGSLSHFATGEVVGKGNKPREFIAGPRAVEAIAQYIGERGPNDKHPALFLSSRNTRLSCRSIQHVVAKWCKELGLPHVHVHQFRHSFACRNVDAGMSSVVLQSLLGHSSLATTQRYFRLGNDRITREYHSVMEFIRESSPV